MVRSDKRPYIKEIHLHVTFSSLLFLVILMSLLFTNYGCGAKPTGDISDEIATNMIGPSGGVVSKGSTQVEVPSGALKENASFIISRVETNEGSVIRDTVYEFVIDNDGIFLEPVTIKINYDPNTPINEASGYMLGTFNNGKWYGIAGSSVSTQENRVSGKTYTFSRYGIVPGETGVVSKIEITTSSKTLNIGETFQLEAFPYNADGEPRPEWILNYKWSSSDPNVVEVDKQTGIITAISAGTAEISAKAVGQDSAPCVVTVVGPYQHDDNVASVIVVPATKTIIKGAKWQFNAYAKNAAGEELSGKAFIWSSSNRSIALVDTSGKAEGVSEGTCSIIAKFGDISGSASLSVTPAMGVYAALEGSDENGDGSRDNPFRTVQKAINVVSNGGEVRLSPGTYTRSGADPIVTWPAGKTATIRKDPERSGEVVLDGAGMVGSAIVSINGNAFFHLAAPSFTANIEDVSIVNGAADSGAVMIRKTYYSTVNLRNIKFTQNYAVVDANDYQSHTGLVLNIENCTIRDNKEADIVIAVESSQDKIGVTLTIKNTRFINNKALLVVDDMWGTNETLVNCVIAGSGALFWGESEAALVNCTIYDNHTIWSQLAYTNLRVVNCVFWGNTQTPVLTGYELVRWNRGVSYSSLQNSIIYPTNDKGGNIIGDPKFVSTDYDSPDFLKLAADSLAINKGTSVGTPSTDIDGKPRMGGYDMGAYEY